MEIDLFNNPRYVRPWRQRTHIYSGGSFSSVIVILIIIMIIVIALHGNSTNQNPPIEKMCTNCR